MTMNIRLAQQAAGIESRINKTPGINELDHDKIGVRHYGFTEEELDFIINYDIKYRMGRSTNEDKDPDRTANHNDF